MQRDKLYLIPFLHQTTTADCNLSATAKLYLIPFLHQTTTCVPKLVELGMLYLIPFLHQTTTMDEAKRRFAGCILFHFYIKPQLEI